MRGQWSKDLSKDVQINIAYSRHVNTVPLLFFRGYVERIPHAIGVLPPWLPTAAEVREDLPGSICLSICVRVYIMCRARRVRTESNVDAAVRCL